MDPMETTTTTSSEATASPVTVSPVQLEFTPSRQLTAWMREHQVSLLLTTYQLGKLFLLGIQPNGRLSVFERTFNRCMGMSATQQTLYLSTLYQLWRFENALQPGQVYEGYDALYVPQVAYATGNIDVHDVHVNEQQEIFFVNTLFSCIATVSITASFKPLWKPSFISRLAAEDRCHLNGLALYEGQPRFVTAVSRTDIQEGWRDHRREGGIVLDVLSNKVIMEGLSMPHSPRWYQDRLWLLDSGRGDFGFINLANKRFEKIAFCPGYARGLSFYKDFAVIGLSKPRATKNFSGLALDEVLAHQQVQPRCGLQVVHLPTGDVVHSLMMEGIAGEIYDVAIVPNIIRPQALGFKTDQICRFISLEKNLALESKKNA